MDDLKNHSSRVGDDEEGAESKIVSDLQATMIASALEEEELIGAIKRELQDLKADLMSSEIIALKRASKEIKNLLSIENPPIQETIELGLVPRLVELSTHEDNFVRHMALWALCNVASGNTEQTLYVISCGALQVMKQGLEDGTEQLKEQSLWGIGNIAGDSPALRDVCLEAGLMPLVLEMLTSSVLTSRKLAAWTISNLCRGKPPPARDDVRSCIPVLVESLARETHEELLSDVVWSLCHLSGCGDDNEVELFNAGVSQHLLNIVRTTDNLLLLAPSLRVLGVLSSGPDLHVDYLIERGFLNDLERLSKIKHLAGEAFWTMSNILGGSIQQNTSAMVLMPTIFQYISAPSDPAALKEALWCFYNALTNCSPEGFDLLLSHKPQQAIIDIISLKHQDQSIFRSLIQAIAEVADKIFHEEQYADVLSCFRPT